MRSPIENAARIDEIHRIKTNQHISGPLEALTFSGRTEIDQNKKLSG